MINKEVLKASFTAVREKSPLVHNITNYVAMNNSANALLAIGASPVMAHATEEMADMVSIAGALVLNIGTLDAGWVEGMLAAGRAMHDLGRPIVLDPVGAGATPYRTRICWDLIKSCAPTIIRGNGSEIMALMDANVQSKGVDSKNTSDSALDSAKQLAIETGSIVVISGVTDYITDGVRVESISNGSLMMPSVTALGCTASSIVGAFVAVCEDPFVAGYCAMAVMGVAGELAANRSQGPGTLQVNFLDELYNLTPEKLAENVRQ